MAAASLFVSLRMSEDNYAKYKQRVGDPPSFHSGVRDSPKVRVTGYNKEAKDAIVASTEDQSEFIEVPWSGIDSMKWIMQRVCDKLRIPLDRWVLAGQGRILSPGLLVASHELFRSSSPSTVVELVLVPIEDVEDYNEENPLPDPDKYVWRHLEPGQTESSDPLEKAKAIYHVIEPVVSPGWEKYLAQRKAAETSLDDILAPYDIDEIEILVDQIKDSVEDIVMEYDLEANEQFAIADCVVPRSIDMSDNGDGEPRTATIFTRIYSPTRPAAVDVWFHYHHRTRWESVEFTCSLLFRVTDPLTEAALPPTSDPLDYNGRITRGWTRMFWMALDDSPPGRHWYAKPLRKWDMRAAHVNRIYAALFGRSERLTSAIDKVDTIRLLLASVGITFYVAREEGESDVQDPDGDRRFSWECFEDDWLGLNIRDACGVPLDKDATWEPPADEEPSEDEYGDSEDEYDDGNARGDCRYQ